MARSIAELDDHVIVCGGGDTGRNIAIELLKTRTPFVVIEIDPAREASLRKLGDEVLYVIGDATDDEMLRQARIDVAFIGMECDGAPLSWVYGPLLTRPLDRKMDQGRRLAGSNYERAVDIVNRFHCRDAYVYAMGQEPWLNYIMSVKYTEQSNPIIASNKLIADCRARGLEAERLFGEKEILLN
mgnify:CR=1 FL=1